MLLGGDAGPNRWGLRTDTMIVVSVDRQTGDLASVSVPRNLQAAPDAARPAALPLPPRLRRSRQRPLHLRLHPSRARAGPAAGGQGRLAELLGIPIDNYVLVDMVGFMRIIDALGGVTVNLSTNVHLVPNIDGQRRRRRRSARARST